MIQTQERPNGYAMNNCTRVPVRYKFTCSCINKYICILLYDRMSCMYVQLHVHMMYTHHVPSVSEDYSSFSFSLLFFRSFFA